MTAIDPHQAEQQTRQWLQDFVVGLNLCPFAKPYLAADNLRISCCEETDQQRLMQAFLQELDSLQSSAEAEIATTLLVFTQALTDFDDYLDFLDQAQELLDTAGLDGVVQLASFHPDYIFAGEATDAASHFSNRSPYPTLHLLREAMLTRVLVDFPNPEAIPERNIETLDAIGAEALQQRWQGLFVKP